MITNHRGVAEHISDWMLDYAKKAGITTWVLGLSGGIDSALCALLAQQTGMPLVCANLPCHSSPSAFDRANAFAEENGIKLFKIDLTEAHLSITKQFNDQKERININAHDTNHSSVAGALRSCLRAPALSFLAHTTNGLIVGTGNRSEDRITRYFQKFGDGCVDMSPIADLWKSEVYSLFAYMARKNGTAATMPPGASAIYEAKPTADLWGADSGQEDEKELGITYDEIEWADREDCKLNLIFHNNHPENHGDWNNYTERQQHVLKTLHRMEKVSRHKQNPNLPVCYIHIDSLRGMVE